MIQRWLSGIAFALLAAFTLVQYNDPDFFFWMPIYGAGAAWCGLAAFWPRRLTHRFARLLLGVSVALSVAGTLYFWPTETGFWRQDVWWESEGAREGMGMMILTACLLVSVVAAALGGSPRPHGRETTD